jgi:DNA segregation ATPase FtsK/SpoIIIE, S-DNA-T family
MDMVRNALDRRRRGTHYTDRMQRILGVCQDCGLLWHEERITHRNGQWEMRRIDDIEAVGEVHVTPQYEKYGLTVRPRVLNRVKNLGPHFAYALNVPNTSVEVDGNVVYVRVPRPGASSASTITFEQAWGIAPDIPRGSVLLGVDEEQQQLVLDLTAPSSVHAAVIGMTGSGKSTLMRTMVLSAQMIGGAQVALFDPSGGLEPVSGHPSVWRGGLFRRAEECELGLEALATTIGRQRRGLMFVAVDEVPDLVAQRPKIRDYLSRLAQAGRHAGLHLIVGAQHPLASELGSSTLRNIAVRLVGRVADPGAAYNASGRRDSGAESLRGRGDFIVVNGSTVRHFQAAYPSAELLRRWAARYPPRPPRVPVRPSKEAPRRQGGVGRGPDEIPDDIVDEIRRFIAENDEPPSLNWVYRTTRERLPSGGFGRDKAQRAIDAALEVLKR